MSNVIGGDRVVNLMNPTNMGIVSPYSLTVAQNKEAMRFAEMIISNLDEPALAAVCGGSENDINKFLELLFSEFNNAVFNKSGKIAPKMYQYIDTLGENIEETLRCESFHYFILSCLPNFVMGWHHIEWCSFVHTIRQSCILAYRGSGKSYFFSNALPLWKMYRFKKRTAYEAIPYEITLCEFGMLFTYETGLGEELLLHIKGQIEENEILRNKLFQERRNEEWSKRSIQCKNGARFQIKSYGSAARGRHPGYIIVDDFLVENVLYSEDQNKKIIDYFNSVIMNMPLDYGPVYVVGTPFKDNDLYGTLRRNKKWRFFEYPAIFPDGTVLQPHRQSLGELLDKKESLGSLVFSREMLCKPVTSDATIFPYQLLFGCCNDKFSLVTNRHSLPTKFKKIVLGCDFAMSANVAADWSVYITLGVDDSDRMWILNIDRQQGKGFGEQIATIKGLHSRFQYDVIYAESNQAQVAFGQELRKAKLPAIDSVTTTNKYDFKTGLPSLALDFELRRFVMPYGDQNSKNIIDMLLTEFTSVAFTDKGLKSTNGHDDIPMALWKAKCAIAHKSSFKFAFA